MKENLLLSESESVRQSTLDANKECYTESSLTDQSEKKFINTTPNSLSKTRNATRCNNRDHLLYLSFTLKISIFSGVYILSSRASMMELLLRKQ